MTAAAPDPTNEHGDWAPQACTLPTVEQPVRRAEFDALFGADVVDVARPAPTRVRLALRPEPGVAARAADLAVRETACCSFFSFRLDVADGALALSVETAAGHVDVLDAFAARAGSRVGAGS